MSAWSPLSPPPGAGPARTPTFIVKVTITSGSRDPAPDVVCGAARVPADPAERARPRDRARGHEGNAGDHLAPRIDADLPQSLTADHRQGDYTRRDDALTQG